METGATRYNRRYISTKESMAYVLFDSSKSFNINAYQMRFIVDVLKIDLDLYSLLGLINGIWDIINDSFIGAIVDKTATRWGKFRPYLLLLAGPGTILGCLYWLTPLFFDQNPLNMGKFIFFLILAMTSELNGTFRGISETGLLGTLTPNPQDRVNLYTQAEVISAIWESIPEILMGILIDLVNHKVLNFSMQGVFITMGTFCAIVAGLLGFFFVIVAKERIVQSSQHHSYKDGLKTIWNNRPMLLIMLSEMTTALTLNTGEQNYFIDVLGSASLRNIIIIPGMPLSFFSYTYFNKVHDRFSTKALWIFGRHLKDVLSLCIFAFGSIGGVKNGLYRQIKYMLPAFMFKDMLYKGTLSINKIPPREILTDALDYCEWKNGYRTEGITLATKGMIVKMVGNVVGSFNAAIMKRIGYSLNAGFGKQSDKTKYGLFALCLVLPGLTGLLSAIPKLFYNLSGKDRARMYEELAEIRSGKHREFAAEISASTETKGND